MLISSNKFFAERLNHCLNDMGAPHSTRERAVILSKLLDISKQQAWGLLEGLASPSDDLMEKIAREFEVETSWLVGKK